MGYNWIYLKGVTNLRKAESSCRVAWAGRHAGPWSYHKQLTLVVVEAPPLAMAPGLALSVSNVVDRWEGHHRVRSPVVAARMVDKARSLQVEGALWAEAKMVGVLGVVSQAHQAGEVVPWMPTSAAVGGGSYWHTPRHNRRLLTFAARRRFPFLALSIAPVLHLLLLHHSRFQDRRHSNLGQLVHSPLPPPLLFRT